MERSGVQPPLAAPVAHRLKCLMRNALFAICSAMSITPCPANPVRTSAELGTGWRGKCVSDYSPRWVLTPGERYPKSRLSITTGRQIRLSRKNREIRETTDVANAWTVFPCLSRQTAKPRKMTRPFDPAVKLFLTTVRRRHPETCPCTDCT